jgi:hypothetical protein
MNKEFAISPSFSCDSVALPWRYAGGDVHQALGREHP